MKVKIVSGGTIFNTKILNADTGDEIEGVCKAVWSIGGIADHTAKCLLEFELVEVDIQGDVEMTEAERLQSVLESIMHAGGDLGGTACAQMAAKGLGVDPSRPWIKLRQ